MSNWVYDRWMNQTVAASVDVPPGKVWLITPGERIEVVGPNGTRQEVTIKPAQVVKIVNIGEESA